MEKEDQLLAASSLPRPYDPSNPLLPRLFVDVLPDTGAWSANYINYNSTWTERYRISFNPKKSKIGLDRIDWVGHQLDAEGLHFSAEQLSEVAQFRRKRVTQLSGSGQLLSGPCSVLCIYGSTVACGPNSC